MSSVKASVIVAVYNGAKTLTQTIESILSQTYDNFELLLIDDGSKNGGVASARNFGIARATGEVIGFCDQDDQWLPQKLEKQIPLFSDPDVGLVYSWVDIARHGKRECSTPEFEGECFEALLNRNFVSCCTAMVRRTVLNQVNGLDESRELHGVDDRHLWLKVARISKLAVAKTPLAIYFIHGENYSLDNKKMLIADLSCIEKIASIEDLTPREKSLCKNAKYNAYKHYANNFLYRNSPQLSASCFLSAWKVKPWHLESLVAASLLSVMPSNLLIKLKQTKNRVQ